ncbi:MAG: N-formylglutamate amidohydrolase, partial [Ignavibacteria bacterium]
NRAEDKAVYLTPADSWGLNVWNVALAEEDISASVSLYKNFYETLKPVLKNYTDTYGKIFIYDIHTYNHMRNGPEGKPDDPLLNPDINIGTGNIDAGYWRNMINDFMNDLVKFDYKYYKPDVKENVKFKGGYFSKWINENFGNDVCVLSIEFKKTFMNEWTGEADNDKVETIKNALASTLPAVLNNLQKKIRKV